MCLLLVAQTSLVNRAFMFSLSLCVHGIEFPSETMPRTRIHLEKKGKSTLQPIAALFFHADLLKMLLLQRISGFVMHTILLTLMISTAGRLWPQYN